MGYEVPAETARITWDEGTKFAGLEAVLSLDVPTDVLLRMDGFGDCTPAQRRDLMIEFGDAVLLEWNLEAKGVPVPATGAGMLSQPPRVMGALMEKWREVISGAGPLEQPSSDTTGLAALSITRAAGQ